MSQKQSVYNMLNQLSEQLDRESVVELVELYATNSHALLGKLNRCAMDGDHPQLTREAHALKSSSANLGAAGLSQLCLELEKSKQFDASISARLDLIRRMHAEALEAMRAWCSE